MHATHPDTLTGALIGPYQVERLIGEGGMGRVYAGHDSRTGRPVAIKVIGQEHAQDLELVARFYAEAHAATRIKHPNIVEVYDLAYTGDGRPSIVMELVEGRTLRSQIQAGTVSVADAIDVMVQVLDALGAAHAGGIVHRDLKPDNILVSEESGRAKVLDFGIAKLGAFESGIAAPRTRTGIMMGTPNYMAPEQIVGGEVDGRTDVYAAGVVLFETLTGRRPFEDESQYLVLRAHLETPPPWASQFRPGLPDAISQIVVQAMAKAKIDRWQSVEAMAAALLEVRSSLSRDRESVSSMVTVREPPSPTPPIPPRRGEWLVVPLAAIVTLALVAAVFAAKREVEQHGATADAGTEDRVVQARVVLPDAGATPAFDPTSRVPRADDFSRQPVPLPVDRFDASAFMTEAERLAREKLADAAVVYAEFPAVRADGTIDLRTQPGDTRWMLWSPSIAAGRPRDLPANLPYRAVCIVVVEVGAQEVHVVRSHQLCDRAPSPRPRCTLRQIWDRAKPRGADPKYVARISFLDGKWQFDIDNVADAKDAVSLRFANDCTP